MHALGREPRAPQPASIPAAYAVLTIQSMDCTACAALIEKNRAQIQGVRIAKVSFKRKVATINYDMRDVAPETFVKAIDKAGYNVTLLRSQGQEWGGTNV